MAARRSRRYFTLAVAVLIAAGLAAAFWPKPSLVDMTTVIRGPMLVTIDEDARTRVHNAYVVSTPITGRLLRVEVEPGDPVIRGETVVAQMVPTNPAALDIRTREQARAAVAAAEAALRVAQADLNKASADDDLANAGLDRARRLHDSGTASQAALEQAQREAIAAGATLDTAEAAISMREAELENSRAQLITFDDRGTAAAVGTGRIAAYPLYSPATGRILRVMQQSETTLSVGTPIMEVGDISGDLEVLVELLSTDAVRVHVGDRVIIDKWGGQSPLAGRVRSIDPWGFTKYSALGVEEQRVNAEIEFTDPPEKRTSLGHGYRVEVRIVVWESEDALIVPSSALFRDAHGNWAVFRVIDGVTDQVVVDIAQNNGLQAAVTSGLSEGDVIVLYPSAGLSAGAKVAERIAG